MLEPMQMVGQVECKWMGKSVQLPIFGAHALIIHALPDSPPGRRTALKALMLAAYAGAPGAGATPWAPTTEVAWVNSARR